MSGQLIRQNRIWKLFKGPYTETSKSHPSYDKMRPKSSQPARLYATGKTRKFSNLDEITVEKLKFRPIVDQTGTVTYVAAKVIGEYLKPLVFNEYKANDCLKFPDMIKALPPLRKNVECFSHDVESLFTNIPLRETIDYIIHKICNKKLLKPISKKLIFKRLLYKLTTDCTIQFNESFYKQIDDCNGWSLSVILADIHMVKTENEVVKPMNPPFYKRFADDIYSRRNKSQQDVLFEALNNFHPKVNYRS